MPESTPAGWVLPFAAQYRASRTATMRLIRAVSADVLARVAGDEGWTVRDEFVHIAASDADFLRTLGGIVDGDPVDLTIFNDIDGRNARNLADRAGHSLAQITADLDASGEGLQLLLRRLTDADESRQPDGMPFPLRGLVQGYGMHEPYHAGQIQAAMETLAR